jgi:prepilin-type N-terminal cleavage/methylation domain-containing protein
MSLKMIRRTQSGFTLVELAVALAVLGSIMVLGWPFLQGWKEAIDLRSTAAGVSDTMLSARMKAVVDRRNYTVSVDYATDAFSVAPPVGTAKKMGSVDIYLDDTDPDCPPLSSKNVVFRPNGTADAAGFEGVYLKSKSARVPVRYRVKVLGATGKVSVEKWAGGEWYGAY